MISNQPPERQRRYTGAVDLILVGERTYVPSKEDILKEALATEFVSKNSLKIPCDGGSIDIAPRKLIANSIPTAMTVGLIFNRITITGRPEGSFSSLEEGTYYSRLDFIEGPEFEEARWLVRIFDARGSVRCNTYAVQVKNIVDFHRDQAEVHEHHFPSVHTHGVGYGDMMARLGLGNDDWDVTCGEWTPIGTNDDGSAMCSAGCVCVSRSPI